MEPEREGTSWPVFHRVHEILKKHELSNAENATTCCMQIAKCAEMFYQSEGNEEKFFIVCADCEMKTFEYDEFLEHFKKEHLQRSGHDSVAGGTEAPTNYFEIVVKDEEIEPEDYIEEEYIDEETIYPENSQTEIGVNEIAEEILPNHVYFQDNNEEGNLIPKTEELFDVPIIIKTKKWSASATSPPSAISVTHTSPRPLIQNVDTVSRNNKIKGKNRESPSDCNKRTCGRCQLEFNSEKSLWHHCFTEYGGYPCPLCLKVFSDFRQMNWHRNSHKHVITSKKVKYFFKKPEAAMKP